MWAQEWVSGIDSKTMKKYLILLAVSAAGLFFAGCSKYTYSPEGYAIVGGSQYSSTLPAYNYIMSIADDLVTDVLGELETAFTVERIGNASGRRFDMSQGSILTEGVSWRVKLDTRALNGMTLTNIGSDTWEMAFEGPYKLGESVYPVNFILRARRGALIAGGSHYNWAVTINGDRTEKEGYACTYSSENTVFYQCTGGNSVGWNNVEGTYVLTVLRYREPIDVWALEFNGSPSTAVFSRGL